MTKSFLLQWNDFPEPFDSESAVNEATITPPLPSPQNLDSHLFIQGDNYPILQKMLPEWQNKIDRIYIDPPYNTGNTFTYNDSFSTKNDRHSAWLSFMFRRLNLAQKLLSPTGCIFIAIDQSELYTLKLLCDQIFGEDNFINDFMWLHGKGKKDKWSRTLQQHTLCYAKDSTKLNAFEEIEYSSWAKTNVDNDPRGNWFSGSISFTEKRSNPNHKNYYTITSPSGKNWTRQWMRTKSQMDELIAQNKIYWGPAPKFDKVPRVKIFNDEPSKIIPKNIIDFAESTRHAQQHLDNLLDQKNAFDNPKPVNLITHLLQITCPKKDAIIMDFFAGSGTTFESVLNLNKIDDGNRKCILIQKPESPQKDSPFQNLAELCWTRLQKNAATFDQKILRAEL